MWSVRWARLGGEGAPSTGHPGNQKEITTPSVMSYQRQTQLDHAVIISGKTDNRQIDNVQITDSTFTPKSILLINKQKHKVS